MHNFYLMKLLEKDLNISKISIRNEINYNFYKENDLNYFPLKIPFENIIKSLNRYRFLTKNINLLKDWLVSREMYLKINEINSDIVEFMDIHSESYYLLKNKNKLKPRIIIRSHTPWSLLEKYYSKNEKKYLDSKMIYRREQFCFQRCDGITVPSTNLKNQLVKLFKIDQEKIFVIPNIIDVNHFKITMKKRHLETFNILHIGRFMRSKGVVTLIKAFIELGKNYKDISMTLIGKTDQRIFKRCEQLLIKNNLNHRVFFKKFVSYELLPDFYEKANVIIVPSEIYESFSYTVAQGMACGKIVIASNIGGIPETVDHGKAGLLFEPGDTQDLIKSVKKVYLKEVDVSYIEKRARYHVKKNYSFEALKSHYLNYYEGQLY